jgi:hypothetical protein
MNSTTIVLHPQYGTQLMYTVNQGVDPVAASFGRQTRYFPRE